jgi:hypothetical protein
VNAEPVPVWLVRAGESDPRSGTLSLTGRALTFTPAEGDPLSLAPGVVTGLRRIRGSPVLELTYLVPREGERLLFLYFAEPPPLVKRDPGVRTRLSLETRGMRRASSLMALWTANRRLKGTVRTWEAAIRRFAAEKRR